MKKIPNAAALDALERLYAEYVARSVDVAGSALPRPPRAKFTAPVADKEIGEHDSTIPSIAEPEESMIAMRILELSHRLGGIIRA